MTGGKNPLSKRQRRRLRKRARTPQAPPPPPTQRLELTPEPAIQDLSDEGWSDRTWFIACTAYRCEFKAEEALRDLAKTVPGVKPYCPREWRETSHAGRRRSRSYPLLGRYILVGLQKTAMGPHGPEFPFSEVKDLPEIEGFLGVHGARVNVPYGKPDPEYMRFDREAGHRPLLTVRAIREAERAGDFDGRAEPAAPLEKGASVRIKTGKFTDFSATILELLPKDRVKLLISIFGRSSPLDLDRDHVELIA